MSVTAEPLPRVRRSRRVAAALDLAIETVLVALLAFCPLALGVVAAWSEAIAFGLGAVLAVLLAVQALASPGAPGEGSAISDLKSQISNLKSEIPDSKSEISDSKSEISDSKSEISDSKSEISDSKFQISHFKAPHPDPLPRREREQSHGFLGTNTRWWIFIPVAAYLAIAAIQLIPLPANFIQTLSPTTLAVRKQFLLDLPNSAKLLSWFPLSLYPLATRHDLRIVLLASIVLVAVITSFAEPRRMRRLMIWIALIGAIVAAVALVQDLTRAKAIYGVIGLHRIADSGPFVNHSHFAQFLNLCLGAALGLLLASFHRDRARSRHIAWWTIPILIAGVITIALSLSRGGIIAMIVAGTAMLLMLGLRRGAGRATAVVLSIAVIALAGLLLAGFDAVYVRIRSATPAAYDMRLEMSRDALRIWRQFPVMGIGLGTHQWIFPRYDQAMDTNLSTHVENEYVQTLEEMGIAGAICVAAFVAIVLSAWILAARKPDMAISGAAIGLGYGLVAVMVHSLSAFGQHLPAVACMSAATCGMLINLAWPNRQPPAKRSRLRAGIGTVTAIAVAGWMAWSSFRAYQAERVYDRARDRGVEIASQSWHTSDADFAQLLSDSTAAVRLAPDNILYRFWDGVFRWHFLTRKENAAGKTVLEGASLALARALVAELNQSRALCPTYGPIYWYIGQRERMLDQPEAGARHIQQAAELAPNNPTALLLAGELDAESGKWDQAALRLNRAVRLNSSILVDVIREYAYELKQPARAIDVVSGNWQLLLQLSNRMARDPALRPTALAARACAMDVLKKLAKHPNATALVLRTLASLQYDAGNVADAEQSAARAIRLNYGNIPLHLFRARCLERLDRFTAARDEVVTALRLDPKNAKATELLHRIEKEQKK